MAQQFRNNPLAPPWMWGGSYSGRDSDEYFIYVLRQALDSNETLNDQPFVFDGGDCFLWGLAASAASGTSDPFLAWRDETGRQISNQLLHLPGWCAGAGDHAAMVPDVIIPPAAQWSFTVRDENGPVTDGGYVHFGMIGVKRRAA